MSYREERREVTREATPYDPTAKTVVQEHVVQEQVVQEQYAPSPVLRDDRVTESVVEDESAGRLSTLDTTGRIVWFFATLLIVDLAARFILKATGANAASGFVQFVYNTTAPFVAPFNGIFGTPAAGSSVLDTATAVAIPVYALIAFFIVRLLDIMLGGPSRGVREYRRSVRDVR